MPICSFSTAFAGMPLQNQVCSFWQRDPQKLSRRRSPGLMPRSLHVQALIV
jgi:hypothetical protein